MKVLLMAIAHGRSGDKGDSANIGIVARREDWYPHLEKTLSAQSVAAFLKPLAEGPVERFELPHLGALNFLVHRALGGGGSRSLRLDAQGKTYAQALLRLAIDIPDSWIEDLKEEWGGRLPEEFVLPD